MSEKNTVYHAALYFYSHLKFSKATVVKMVFLILKGEKGYDGLKKNLTGFDLASSSDMGVLMIINNILMDKELILT